MYYRDDMPFVKLDCGMLNSTLWFDKPARDIFITALLMAEPHELTEPSPQIEVDSLKETGWQVPPGWYGMVPAAGIGIIHRTGLDEQIGIEALRRLGNPEASSRSPDFDGRRMVRVNGGYILLNFIRYRERDYTAAERSRRYRERKSRRSGDTLHRDAPVATRNVTQAEAEAEAKLSTLKALKGEDNPLFEAEPCWPPSEEQELMDYCLKVLGKDCMVTYGGAWRNRARENPSKLKRVLHEIASNQREGKCIRNPGGYAKDLWERFA